MKTTALLSACCALAANLTAYSADAAKPLLAVPGKGIVETPFDTAPGTPWKVLKGKWEAVEGVTRAAELPEDKHGAVMRLPNKLTDFVIDYEFKFEGAKSTSLSINTEGGHLARLMITPKSVTLQRDDMSKDHSGKAEVFARSAVDFKSGTWHKVHFEMVGSTALCQVDEWTAYGVGDALKLPKLSPGLTVGGQSVDFRNFRLREASLNPEWETVRGTLPAPGAAPAPAKGKGKGQGGAAGKK